MRKLSKRYIGPLAGAVANQYFRTLYRIWDPEIRHFTPREILYLGPTHYSGRAKNTLPPPDLLPNLITAVKAADELRERLGSPIKITSAYRSHTYNRAVGGAPSSYHLRGLALDLKPLRASASQLRQIARQVRAEGIFTGGIGKYSTFVHIDTRGYEANW